MNKRHDLDPVIVSGQIEKEIKRLTLHMEEMLEKEKENHILYQKAKKDGTHVRWLKPRTDLDADLKDIKLSYEAMIKDQRDYFGKVRVIELDRPEKAFVLVYGDQKDSEVTRGTGPFDSVEKAIAWFANGGR
tara:strand:+ start:12521 stop:12916 length:396 start_codon:yes stop_codon:yes gene_type:complete